jgi:Tn3 transposase DDE domain
VSGFCAQAGIPTQAPALVAHYRQELARTAARVDAGYPANTDLVLEGDKPVLKRRKGVDRRPEAIALEAAIHQRLPERSLLDVLTRAAYLTGWYRHFGPASGSDPKIRDSLGRYVITTYAYGTNFGPAEVARHLRGSVSAHEIYTAGNKHADASKVYRASTDVINEFAKLDVAGIWGDGQVVAVDGSQVDTWENNLLAESHIRYGGYGGIAMRHVADSYIALFSHFIPCGVWEAVYIIDGLLRNESDIQPDTVHADTQGHLVTWTPRAPQVGRAERHGGVDAGRSAARGRRVHPGPASRQAWGAGGGGLRFPLLPGGPRLFAEHPGVLRV